jgi:hypothetical protein
MVPGLQTRFLHRLLIRLAVVAALVNNKTPTPANFWMCGKQRTLSRVFLEVWQGKGLGAQILDVWQRKELDGNCNGTTETTEMQRGRRRGIRGPDRAENRVVRSGWKRDVGEDIEIRREVRGG